MRGIILRWRMDEALAGTGRSACRNRAALAGTGKPLQDAYRAAGMLQMQVREACSAAGSGT